MNCMKCGREILDGVFCQECLADMEKYPVKPGTVILLPRREQTHAVKKAHPRKKVLSAEEQVQILSRRVRILTIALCILFLIAAALVYPAVSYIVDGNTFLPGQNYTAIVPSAEPTEETEPSVIILPPMNTAPIPEETV